MRTDNQTVYKERAILAGVCFPDESKREHRERLEELRRLGETAGARIQDQITQNRTRPDSTYFVGSGKADEILSLVEKHDANVVIFDNDLSPAQQANLKEKLDVRVIDRSELILDIFSLHASSKAAKLQVELARLKYTLPRLKRMWTHLSRQAGGIGARGPGERQIEMDRRLANERITELSEKLEEVQEQKKREVKQRADEFTISFVGYTNAGKSTLMNQLTDADIDVEDKLFSTLSTKTKKWSVKDTDDVLLSDTVGFIQNLPHHLVASFRSTLEETTHADLLLHVVDSSHPSALDHIESVKDTLDQIGADEIPTILLLNKQDKLENGFDGSGLRAKYPDALEISARTGQGLDRLEERVSRMIDEKRVDMQLEIPAVEGKLLNMIHGNGRVLESEPENEHMRIHARLGPRYASQIPDEYVLRAENGNLIDNGSDQNHGH